MAKVNPWAQTYARPEPEPTTRTLVALDGPPEGVKLAFHPMDELQRGEAVDRFEDLMRKYMTGDPVDNGPIRISLPGHQTFRFNRDLLNVIAALQTQQIPEEGDEPYTEVEWAGFAKQTPKLWRKIRTFAGEVQNNWDNPAPNRTGETKMSDSGTTPVSN